MARWQSLLDTSHPSSGNIHDKIQQLQAAIWHGKVQLGKLEETRARLCTQSVKWDKTITKFQLESAYMGHAKE